MNKLRQKLTHRHSDFILWIRPRLLQMPLPVQRYDDPFLPFGKAIISATHDLLCGYMFDLAAYLALGAAGAVALERTIAYVGEETVSILHGPFASSDYVDAAGALNVDAVTLVDSASAESYVRAGISVFALDGEGVGMYSLENFIVTLDDFQLRLLSDDLLYAGRGDDFTDVVRAAVKEQLR